MLSLVSFAGMTLDKCVVLRIGTLTGCPLCREREGGVSLHTLVWAQHILFTSVVRLLDFHNRSSKIIVQEVSIDDRL